MNIHKVVVQETTTVGEGAILQVYGNDCPLGEINQLPGSQIVYHGDLE